MFLHQSLALKVQVLCTFASLEINTINPKWTNTKWKGIAFHKRQFGKKKKKKGGAHSGEKRRSPKPSPSCWSKVTALYCVWLHSASPGGRWIEKENISLHLQSFNKDNSQLEQEEEMKGESDLMWQWFSPAATFTTFHPLMLNLSGDTAGLVRRLKEDLGDYEGAEHSTV